MTSISWINSSLVGSLNNSNTGFRHVSETNSNHDTQDTNFPSNMIVQFTNQDGIQLGNIYDVPLHSNVTNLSQLIHSLLCEQDQATPERPYAFYTDIRPKGQDKKQVELDASLKELIEKYGLGTEDVLTLVYKPQSVYRVRPVSRCTDTMVGHEEAVLYVEYSPDGLHLASGGGDTHVRFWDIHTSLPKHTCTSHTNHVLFVSWSPNSQSFASCDLSGKLITWDPIHGKPKKIIQAHLKHVSCMSWEPCHLNEGRCERLVTGSKDGLSKVWNVRLAKKEMTLSGHAGGVECVKWSGLGYIYTASRDTTIRVYAADKSPQSTFGTLIKTLTGHSHRINTLALNCDYICRTGPFDFENQHRLKLQKLQLSQKKAHELSLTRYQTFHKHNNTTEILVSGSDDLTIHLYHPQSSKHPIQRLTGHQQLINHLSFSPNGQYFLSASFDKKVKLWSREGTFLRTFQGHVSRVYRVSWSLDSRYLVSASKDSTVKLWSVKEGNRCKETLPGHADEVYALDWSPDGRSVATGSKDRTIKIWKA